MFAKTQTVLWLAAGLWSIAIAGLAFLWNLGSVSLIDETEPLFAEAARQMTVTGDWITPYFNGETRFDKPPLIYWLMAIAYHVFGVNEWAVRLPSALSAIFLTLFLFLTVRTFGISHPWQRQIPSSNSVSAGLGAGLAATLFALNIQVIAWGRTGVSDMLLTACMDIGLLAFFWGYATGDPEEKSPILGVDLPQLLRNPNIWYFIFYLAIALAILAKGPVGIVLPALIIGSFLLYLGEFTTVVREMKLVWGLFLIGAIAIPWYVAVIVANGQTYIDSFFGYHNFERFTQVVNRHGEPWYFYFAVVLLGFAPWSSYLPLGLARSGFWKRQRWQSQPRSRQLTFFAFTWFAVIFIFFTIAATKLPSYVLPLIPAAAILTSLFWSEELENPSLNGEGRSGRSPRRFFHVSIGLNLLLLLLLAAAFFWSRQLLGRDPSMPEFRDLLQSSGLALRAAAILTITAGAIALSWWQGRSRPILAINLMSFLLFFTVAVYPIYILFDSQRQIPVREMADRIVELRQADEEVIMVGFEKPSLVFYTRQPITFFRRSTDTREYVQDLARKSSTPETLMILGYPNKIRGTGLRPPDYQVLAEAGNYRLIRVEKQEFLEF
ncbi:glycosyltransferase family 39 protein [Oxynema sp. CENA135]|uniref:ArnT family glycosyltransferase n=1 Tax=Oxynema sp. CENA135 TaxID=984206 RepID=UPI001F34A72C|nr:glycosyltransferase family 39 protein [Oxynema sp. CENA135]